MIVAGSVLIKSYEVANRLNQLGLAESQLLDAATRGLASRFSCTPHHPPMAPGFYGWSETVRGLRDVLIPLGWTRDDAGLLSLVVSPDGKIAVAVATGDEDTGDPEGCPCTKSSKGTMTKHVVEENAFQLHLFEDQEALKTPEQITLVRSRMTYWLLIHIDRNTLTLRTELSAPVFMGIDGKLAGWDERIILGEIPFDSEPTVSDFDQGDGPNTGVSDDIEVKRRA